MDTKCKVDAKSGAESTKAIQAVCPESEYAAIKKAADAEKRSMASFVLFHALEAAKRTNG